MVCLIKRKKKLFKYLLSTIILNRNDVLSLIIPTSMAYLQDERDQSGMTNEQLPRSQSSIRFRETIIQIGIKNIF